MHRSNELDTLKLTTLRGRARSYLAAVPWGAASQPAESGDRPRANVVVADAQPATVSAGATSNPSAVENAGASQPGSQAPAQTGQAMRAHSP